jgi:hypothetical protein
VRKKRRNNKQVFRTIFGVTIKKGFFLSFLAFTQYRNNSSFITLKEELFEMTVH